MLEAMKESFRIESVWCSVNP